MLCRSTKEKIERHIDEDGLYPVAPDGDDDDYGDE
jgi:hypothetical protein